MSLARALYFTRIPQFLFGVGFLIILCWSGVHRGWWNNINGALALGVVASIFTFAVTLHTLVTHHLNRNPFFGGSAIRTFILIACETFTFVIWIGTAAAMLRQKGGCGYNGGDRDSANADVCFTNPPLDNYKLYTDQPTVEWDLGIAFTFVEMWVPNPRENRLSDREADFLDRVSFLVTIFMVFKNDRATKVSSAGGTSSA